jgi:hypothetical protein
MRDRAHIAMWQNICRSLGEEVDKIKRQLADAQQELRDRPIDIRLKDPDLERVEQAHEEARLAYEARDRAFGAMSDLRLRHHRQEKNTSQCTCGLRYDHCHVAQIVDRFGALKHWEEKQLLHFNEGRRHWLERDHPALTDPDWLDRQSYQ